MKITIELSEAEVKGLKQYLNEVGDIERPTKTDIQNEIQGIVSGNLHAPKVAVADYINEFEKQMTKHNEEEDERDDIWFTDPEEGAR